MKQNSQQTQSTVYYPAAQVRSANLDEVFRLTQGIELSEAELALVHWMLDRPRSSMVGDLVVNDSGVYRCQSFGWKRM